MLFAGKPGRSYPVRVAKIDGVQTAGYSVISASSRPPYGPHIVPHKARVWGGENTTLENIRVVDAKNEARLGRIQRHITQLRKEHTQILQDNFLTFRLATISDFDPAIVMQGLTKEQAQAKLPKGKEAEKMVKQGKWLAGFSKELSNILR